MISHPINVVLKQFKMTRLACNHKEKTNRTVVIIGVVLSILFKVFELVSDAIFSFLHRNDKTEKLPSFKNLILLDSATSLAAKIRNQTVSVNIIISVYNFLSELVSSFLLISSFQVKKLFKHTLIVSRKSILLSTAWLINDLMKP